MLLTSPEEILNVASALPSGKSAGTDNIPIEFFKHAPSSILGWISKFFNALLIHQYVPQSITEVILTPLLKSSLKDPCNSNSYRPIARATAASKIFEHIILNRLSNFLQTTDFQFGFKKGHGTDMCIFQLIKIL